MKNDIRVNLENLNDTERDVLLRLIEKANNSVRLSDIAVGETFKLGDLEFIVLDKFVDGICVILKDFWITDKFDSNTNNYADSDIRRKLNKEFYNKISALCGADNIMKHMVYLTSDDGRKDYGFVEDNISLITCDMYRKYVDIFDKYRITSNWWWTATPYSTKSNGYSSLVRCVYRDGTLNCDYCRNDFGVRPFCILKSCIFVSR